MSKKRFIETQAWKGADIRELQSYNSKSTFANVHNFAKRVIDKPDVLGRFNPEVWTEQLMWAREEPSGISAESSS